jgi:predicted dehydrogenase
MDFGLIGTGLWAREVHAAAAATHQEVNFVGVWGRNHAKALAIVEPIGATAFASIEELLPEVDAVGFAVPPTVQPFLAIRAARAGKHLLLEKPLALTSDLANEVYAVVRGNGVGSVVFFTARWIPEYAKWFSELAGENGWEFGLVELLSSAMVTESGFESSIWRKDFGALWDLGPHGVAMLQAVLGDVEAVSAINGVRDQVHIIMKHVTGASSILSTSSTVPDGAAADLTCYFYGRPGRKHVPVLDPCIDYRVIAYHSALDSLITQARTGVRDEIRDVRLGVNVVVVLEGANESLASGTVRMVPPTRAPL